MKKRYLFILLFLFNISFFYADHSNAMYIGKDYELDIDRYLANLEIEEKKLGLLRGNPILKLKDYEKRLLEEAVSEYQVQKGDLYYVLMVIDLAYCTDILRCLVRIDRVYNNGNEWNYTWWSIGRTSH